MACLNVVNDLWSATTTNPFRDRFLCFNFQRVNFFFLFHLLFLILLPMDFFGRNEVSVCRYSSTTSMVCHCVAHQKLIDLSCVVHVTPYFPLQSPPQCLPPFQCFTLPANRFSLYLSPLYHCRCYNGNISRPCPLCLHFNRQVLLQCLKSLVNRSRT